MRRPNNPLSSLVRARVLLAAACLAWQGASFCQAGPVAPVKGRTDLATLLPAMDPYKVLEQWQNNRYGIVVGTNASIALVYSPAGEALLSANSWYLQGQGKDEAGKPAFSYRGAGDGYSGPIRIYDSREGHRIFEVKDAVSGHARWSKRITCLPDRIKVELAVTPIEALPEGVRPGLTTKVKILARAVYPFNEPGANPINVLTDNSSFNLHFPTDFRWYKGYFIQGDTVVFSPLKDSSDFVVGTTYLLDYEIRF
jgi:hypothetical protein